MAKTSRTTRLVDQKYLGGEPKFNPEEIISGTNLIRTYNWYNHFMDAEKSKTFLNEYCKANDIEVDITKHNKNTFGWIARILSMGGRVEESAFHQFTGYLSNLRGHPPSDNQAVSDNQVVMESIADSKIDVWMAQIEEAIDNYNTSFDMYSFLTTNSIPQMYARQIADFYKRVSEELVLAYEKKDEQLTEAYRNYSRSELKKFRVFVDSIIENCEKYLGNVKKERKPRKPMTKSVSSILKHFKYLEHDNNLKISSEDPSKILGASAVYVLNTKYNTLTMFVAKDANGFGISRTAISNYDEKQSMTKRAGRKLDEVINQITTGTKRSRLKVMDKISTDPSKFTDRLNEHSLILKIDK